MSSKIFSFGRIGSGVVIADRRRLRYRTPRHFTRGYGRSRSGRNYQPTEHELRALHREDVTADQAREIDRLYDRLLASSEKARNRHHAPNIDRLVAETDFFELA